MDAVYELIKYKPTLPTCLTIAGYELEDIQPPGTMIYPSSRCNMCADIDVSIAQTITFKITIIKTGMNIN